MSLAKRSLPFWVFAGMLTLVGQTYGQFESAAKWVPDGANMLALVQGKKIFDSKLSKQEGWKTDQIKAFKSGAAFLPATIERVLISAQMDLDTLQPVWKVSVLEKYGPEVNIANVSEKTNGTIENINGKDAVALPNDTYFVQVDDTTLAVMTPANRQATGRWLNSKASPAITLSKYLNKAVSFADDNADIVIALDMEHVLDLGTTAQKLKMGGFANDNDLKPVAEALSKIQGLMLGITVNDKITGALRLDFDSNVAILKPYAKQIIMQVLGRRGATIDDLANWSQTESGNSIVFAGPMSESGFRQVLSLFRHSIQHDIITQSPGDQTDTQADPGTRSKQYFSKLESIVTELSTIQQGRALNTYAKFFEQYASEIDGWSILGVDDDLAKFGTYVSDNCRDCAGVLRDAQFTKSNQQAANNADRWGTYGYGGYAYGYNWNYNSQRRAIGTQQNNAGAEAARDILRNVGKQMAELRRALTTKYKIDF